MCRVVNIWGNNLLSVANTALTRIVSERIVDEYMIKTRAIVVVVVVARGTVCAQVYGRSTFANSRIHEYVKLNVASPRRVSVSLRTFNFVVIALLVPGSYGTVLSLSRSKRLSGESWGIIETPARDVGMLGPGSRSGVSFGTGRKPMPSLITTLRGGHAPG